MDEKTIMRREEDKQIMKEAIKEYFAELATNQKVRLANRIIDIFIASLLLGALWLIAWTQGWFK